MNCVVVVAAATTTVWRRGRHLQRSGDKRTSLRRGDRGRRNGASNVVGREGEGVEPPLVRRWRRRCRGGGGCRPRALQPSTGEGRSEAGEGNGEVGSVGRAREGLQPAINAMAASWTVASLLRRIPISSPAEHAVGKAVARRSRHRRDLAQAMAGRVRTGTKRSLTRFPRQRGGPQRPGLAVPPSHHAR